MQQVAREARQDRAESGSGARSPSSSCRRRSRRYAPSQAMKAGRRRCRRLLGRQALLDGLEQRLPLGREPLDADLDRPRPASRRRSVAIAQAPAVSKASMPEPSTTIGPGPAISPSFSKRRSTPSSRKSPESTTRAPSRSLSIANPVSVTPCLDCPRRTSPRALADGKGPRSRHPGQVCSAAAMFHQNIRRMREYTPLILRTAKSARRGRQPLPQTNPVRKEG